MWKNKKFSFTEKKNLECDSFSHELYHVLNFFLICKHNFLSFFGQKIIVFRMQSSCLCIKESLSTILNLKLLVGNSKNHACRPEKIQDVVHFSPIRETYSSQMNYSVISLVKPLRSRNLCEKVRENFCHTVFS